MDFSLSTDEQVLARTARELMARLCPPSLVRAHLEDPAAADALSPVLAEWAGLATAPLVDRCLVLEQAGARLLPGPFFATVALYGPLLAAVGADDELAAVAAGQVWGTVAAAGPDGRWRPHDGDRRAFVAEADRVARLAVVRSATVTVHDGPVPGDRLATLDSTRRLFDIATPAATGAPSWPLPPAAADDWLAAAHVALAAETLGTSRRLLEMTLDHARQRVQFGQPIGAFQAVQHQLADMALAVERAAAAVYEAAMAADAGHPDRHRLAHVAAAAAGAAATGGAKQAVQTHGGIGYTWDHDLHLHVRRAYASEAWIGDRRWHLDRIADRLFA